MVASDNSSAVQACNGKLRYADYIGTVVENIRRLAEELTEIRFVFERRQTNECAHLLAKWGSSHNSSVILIEEACAFINSCIVKD